MAINPERKMNLKNNFLVQPKKVFTKMGEVPVQLGFSNSNHLHDALQDPEWKAKRLVDFI